MTPSAVIEPRSPVGATPPDAHGAPDYAELEALGLTPGQVLDFSVNSNPFGPSPAVRVALRDVPLDRYPDREALALRRAISAHLGLPVEQVAVGNGAAELLWLIALAYLRPGDPVLILTPTFGEYARAVSLMGGRVRTVAADAADDFALDLGRVAAELDEWTPRLAFICNPNNPTGRLLPLSVLEAFATRHPATLFVVDEAYIAFAAGARSALGLELPNVLVLRSMTKDYGLAGLRLGYAAGPRAVIDALRGVTIPWSVNALAQAAGVAALADGEHLSDSLRRVGQAHAELVEGLRGLDLCVVPSDTHYGLVEVGDGAAFRRALLAHRIQVRDCASFGLPAYVRIATRRPEENAQLLAAIRAVQAAPVKQYAGGDDGR